MNKPSQQQVVEAYKKLPPPVREFLADPDKLARVLENIRNAHGLHIDVAGQIGESVGYLLLGLANPNEFKEMLKTAKVSEATASDIIGEINQKIFVPLREEMRKGASTLPAPAPARPSIQHPPLPRPPTPQRRPAELERYFHLENKIPPPVRPAPPRPAAATNGAGPRPPVSNSNIAPLPPKGVLPASSQKLLRDREEPHLEIKKTAPVPKPSFVPPNLPGAMPPTPIQHTIHEVRPSPTIPKVEPQIQPKLVPPPAPVTAKPYTTDPYREPIGGGDKQ